MCHHINWVSEERFPLVFLKASHRAPSGQTNQTKTEGKRPKNAAGGISVQSP